MENNHRRYIPIINITTKNNNVFTLSIGNPLWFIKEIKNMRKEVR